MKKVRELEKTLSNRRVGITIEIPDEYLMKMTGIAASINVKIFCNSERFHVKEVPAHVDQTEVQSG